MEYNGIFGRDTWTGHVRDNVQDMSRTLKFSLDIVLYQHCIHGITNRMKRSGIQSLGATIPVEDTQVAANNSARSSLRSSSVTMEEWFIWGNYVCHYGGTHLDFYSTHDMSP